MPLPPRTIALLVLSLVGLLPPPAFAEAPPGNSPQLPPLGIEISAADRTEIEAGVTALAERLAAARGHEHADRIAPVLADVEIYRKAVDYALRNDEFFRPEEVGRARELLATANARLDQLLEGLAPWAAARGLVVRGYRSRVDDSVQPYGLVIPEGLDLTRPVPLYVWLHGRGDKSTDLNFIYDRQISPGTIAPAEAIVLHPFGRYCNAFKFAGETDVFEAIESVQQRYRIDPDRIVLWGFSMGGAGAWHLGAHYPDRWVAVSPGAGFAETARYQDLDPATVAPAERTLWRLYDVPGYTRNFFHVPVFAYSGENDKQIQCARVMEEAFAAEGRTLTHLIGPGMGHQYHPDTLVELSRLVAERVAAGLDHFPRSVSLQTQTLRYNRAYWVEVLGLMRHWQDTRVDAEVTGERQLRVITRNVTVLALYPPWPGGGFESGAIIDIDGQTVEVPQQVIPRPMLVLDKSAGSWVVYSGFHSRSYLRKRPKLSGPIDDAFFDPFLVVLPSGPCAHPQVDAWVTAELAHFQDRWRRLFRGELRTKHADEVTYDDMLNYHLILWGDRASNRLIDRMAHYLPVEWGDMEITVGDQSFDASSHVPVLVFPNMLTAYPPKYVVFNSGPTFREGDDRTNSLQTPKLPDWSVIDLSEPAGPLRPGRIAASGFFDEMWRLQPVP